MGVLEVIWKVSVVLSLVLGGVVMVLLEMEENPLKISKTNNTKKLNSTVGND